MKAVLDSIRPVLAQGRSVRLDPEAVEAFCERLTRDRDRIRPPPWEARHHFHDGTARTVAYLLALDALNFCFWGDLRERKWSIRYRGERLSGYFALAACLKRAFEEGWPLDEARYLADIPRGDVERLLAGEGEGEGEIPLLEERWRVLREVGQKLLERFDGRAATLVERAGGSALKLVEALVRHFPSFRDEARYRGRRVRFYKRAQILCADLYGSFSGRRWGRFEDLDRLTAFADYKLPQVLRACGILRYTDELAARVDRREELPPGSEEEVEIRAHTIQAVEEIKAGLRRRGIALRSFEVDWLLWDLGRRPEFRRKPHHRVRTIFY